jgi:hypothetical protein
MMIFDPFGCTQDMLLSSIGCQHKNRDLFVKCLSKLSLAGLQVEPSSLIVQFVIAPGSWL